MMKDKQAQAKWTRSRKMQLAMLISLAVGLVVAGFMFIGEFDKNQAEIADIGHRSTETFDREMQVRVYTLKAMQLACDQYLANLTALTWNPADHLRLLPEKDGYVLMPIDTYSDRPIGELTGLGPIPPADSLAAAEMGMAISLTPFFQAIEQRDADTPWIYYTSASGFIYMYPKVSWEDFFFSPEVFAADFFRGVRPSENPQRSIYWTPRYFDLAGKGFMVTVSAPIYKGDTFAGSLSIDISLAQLKWLLERYEFPHSTPYLVDGNGEMLIDMPGLASFDFKTIKNGVPHRSGEYYLVKLPLGQAGWFLIIQTSVRELVLASLKEPLAWGFTVALLLFCGMLIILLRQSIDEIAEMSVVDPLTGLYNRRQFDIIAPMYFVGSSRRKENFAFLIYDLDDFKMLNDTYGHQIGDKVLVAVSQTVSSLFQRKNDYVFRTGGEEFIVLATTSDANTLQVMADSICKAVYDLRIPNITAEIPYVTISMGGVFIAGWQRVMPEEAYKIADQALYEAKSRGKNQAIIVDIIKQSTDGRSAQ